MSHAFLAFVEVGFQEFVGWDSPQERCGVGGGHRIRSLTRVELAVSSEQAQDSGLAGALNGRTNARSRSRRNGTPLDPLHRH